MPAFSFSAPQYSKQDETRERSSLTEEEVQEIQDDLHGINKRGAQHPPLLSDMETALQGIANEDKDEYLEALERCPHLVEAESCPLRFLLSERDNATAAAYKLVGYWKMRKSLFKEHAFMPLKEAVAGNANVPALNHHAASALSINSNDASRIMGRDIHGRLILGTVLGGIPQIGRLNMIKDFWLQVHFGLGLIGNKDQNNAIDSTDPAAGSNAGGVVLVAECGRQGGLQSFDRIVCKLLAQSLICLPLRVQVFHVHLHSEIASVLYRFAAFFFQKHDRVRIQLHHHNQHHNHAADSDHHDFHLHALEQHYYHHPHHSSGGGTQKDFQEDSTHQQPITSTIKKQHAKRKLSIAAVSVWESTCRRMSMPIFARRASTKMATSNNVMVGGRFNDGSNPQEQP